MSAQSIFKVDEKDSKKINFYDQVVTPTRISDDMLFSLLASFTTESIDQIIGTLNSVFECSGRVEKTNKKQIVPTDDVNAQYKTALNKYQQGVGSKVTPSYVAREPRVSFFYHNDHESCENEHKQGSVKDITSEKKKSKELKKSTEESKKSKKPHNPRDRRRVISYVWVDVTPSDLNPQERKGIVYYGGSVYNPIPTVRGVLKRLIEKRITSKEQLMNTINMMKTEYSSPSNYNRMGEKKTAFGRLCQRPIVFETSASTHQQVREEIKKLMFSCGVFGKRVTDDMNKEKKKD